MYFTSNESRGRYALVFIWLLGATSFIVTTTEAFAPLFRHHNSVSSANSERDQVKQVIPTPFSLVRKTIRTTSTQRYAGGEQDNFSEITNTLARLDRQWKIQQSSKRGASRWITLRLDDDNNNNQQKVNVENNDGFSSSSYTNPFESIPNMSQPPPFTPPPSMMNMPDENVVYLLEPPNKSIPSSLIVFVGGAGLGTYPHIAYNELLLRISNRLNAAILAVPYNVGLDHFSLARATGEKAHKALELLLHPEDSTSTILPGTLSLSYPENLPVFCLTHSLGGKLMTIHLAATNPDYAGMGWISFNNFGFSRTIGMAKEFAQQLSANTVGGGFGRTTTSSSSSSANAIMDQIFQFAEMAVATVGLDFTPTPEQMEKLITLKFDAERQAKTRLFTFDQDRLQNTQDFVQACQSGSGGPGPAVSELPGNHLSPVYFELGLDQIPADDDTRSLIQEAMGGFQKASYGNEQELNALVDEVCGWILGKSPSKRPDWQRETPLIAAASAAAKDQDTS